MKMHLPSKRYAGFESSDAVGYAASLSTSGYAVEVWLAGRRQAGKAGGHARQAGGLADTQACTMLDHPAMHTNGQTRLMSNAH